MPPRYHQKSDSFCRKPAGVCTSRGVCSRSIGGCAGRNGRVSSLKLSAEMSPKLSPAWVQVWVQLKNEKWLPISRKRHQIGHLDFRSFRLLTDRLQVQILPGEPTSCFRVTWIFRKPDFLVREPS